MSVLITLTTVTLMLPVSTLLGASPVPVTMDTLGMDSTVLVCISTPITLLDHLTVAKLVIFKTLFFH